MKSWPCLYTFIGSIFLLSTTIRTIRFTHEDNEMEEMDSEMECGAILKQIPSFLLNLDRRQDRLHRISQVLSKSAPWLSSQTCRISAPDGQNLTTRKRVDGKLISRDALRRAVNRQKKTLGGSLTKGAVALILGHGHIWEHIRQRDFPFGIVMEDDIDYLHPKLSDFICKLVRKPPKDDWEYIQLQYWERSTTLHINDNQDLLLEPGTPAETGMYLISKSGADKILSHQFPIGVKHRAAQLDSGPLHTHLKTFQVKPRAAHQVGSKHDTDVQILKSPSLLQEGLIPDCPRIDASKMRLAALQAPF